MPTQNHLEILLQRIGYSDMMLQSYVDESDFLAHELKFKIRQAYIEKDTTKAQELLQQFTALIKKPTATDQQFILLYRVLLYPQKYTNEECLQELEKAISLTCPSYQHGRFPFLLSYEEIVLLNNIAIYKSYCGMRKEAIDILYGIHHYYNTHMVNTEETLRSQPMTLYNLSKMLGLENRFDECIEICDLGIKLAQKTGRCQEFAHTLYNKAWALWKKGGKENLAASKVFVYRALNVGIAFEDEHFVKHCERFIQEHSEIYCTT